MTGRETIYAALFALGQTIPGLVSATRTFRTIQDVAASETPLLIQTQRQQTAHVVTQLPTEWALHATWWLYVTQEASGARLPAQVLNDLIDAAETVLAPAPALVEQTLGGRVHRCRIDGTIETDEGLLAGKAVAMIPLVVTSIPTRP